MGRAISQLGGLALGRGDLRGGFRLGVLLQLRGGGGAFGLDPLAGCSHDVAYPFGVPCPDPEGVVSGLLADVRARTLRPSELGDSGSNSAAKSAPRSTGTPAALAAPGAPAGRKR